MVSLHSKKKKENGFWLTFNYQRIIANQNYPKSKVSDTEKCLNGGAFRAFGKKWQCWYGTKTLMFGFIVYGF
jgi:hypothetical protein